MILTHSWRSVQHGLRSIHDQGHNETQAKTSTPAEVRMHQCMHVTDASAIQICMFYNPSSGSTTLAYTSAMHFFFTLHRSLGHRPLAHHGSEGNSASDAESSIQLLMAPHTRKHACKYVYRDEWWVVSDISVCCCVRQSMMSGVISVPPVQCLDCSNKQAMYGSWKHMHIHVCKQLALRMWLYCIHKFVHCICLTAAAVTHRC